MIKKRVLFCIPYLSDGGAERALANITCHWPADWTIDILVNNDDVVDYSYRGNIITLGIKGRVTDSIFFQFKVSIMRIVRLRELKASGQYDACISFIDSANFANIFSKTKKCKTIISVRSSLEAQKKYFNYRFVVNPLAKLLYRHADIVTAVSEELRDELTEHYCCKSDKTVSITNGYDINEMMRKSEGDDTEGIPTGKCIVLTAGRQTTQKKQWNLIRSFKRVLDEVPEAVLVIAGRGELEDYQKQLARDLGIADRVLFLGFVKNVYRLMDETKVFVLPSGWEGFPNALAEAVCMGLPCIATDFHTGAREILAPELMNIGKIEDVKYASYGIVTPASSDVKYNANDELEYAEERLADAIIELLSNDKFREEYCNKSVARRTELSIEHTVERWISVIEMCCENV